ncbi:hypothetical protein NLX71_06465 [Paenibacillus sp. MZ04-78.2]|uniref:hypothetical protein n=1 Tax=Paenibacillus sp. MZ04-78.2 TaxID=2962034 RepID=UPI0020B76B9B|nr:hypothetical protein [Paenibacillus sp. MZ04-78.2]MCP3772967.1 hypothetical protein [Paenibacillus sp. MZ04-78.2]
MKSKLNKVLLPAIALSLMIMAPAIAEGPSRTAGQQQPLLEEIAFQLPTNNYCSAEQSLDFSFQLSNAGSTPADITVSFYQQDGGKFTTEGTSYQQIGSTIIPGKPFTLKGNATGLYHINFGNHLNCNDRIYLGKISVNSGKASLLARGWVNMKGAVQNIEVNGNQTFELAAVPTTSEAAAAKAEK